VGDLAIRVEGLGKRYTIGERPGLGRRWLPAARRRLLGGRHNSLAAPAGRSTIWAVRDVSFEIGFGEVVGVVGRNGAGKSTLLKILSRIVRPDTGHADIHGRVASLLEVGTGFHPELTGRDNVFLNGAILGMRRSEIARKFDEIVAFSGVEKFIDTAVKHYSSGMYVRLAFAVAAHLEPEVLLVDEVLAVGDAAFQSKCLDRIGEVSQEGRTVLFVSHNVAAITRLCSRTLWIDEGRLKSDGPSDDVVSRYFMAESALHGEQVWPEGVASPDVTEFKLRAVRARTALGDIAGVIDVRQPFTLEIEYEVLAPLPYCRVGVIIETADGVAVVAAYDADDARYTGPRRPGIFTSSCVIPAQLLNPGRFVVSVNAGITQVKNLASQERALSFEVLAGDGPRLHASGVRRRRGVIYPRFEWRMQACLDGTESRGHGGVPSIAGERP
jgi:lipopolysaccharide transport system ATP-binding protein